MGKAPHGVSHGHGYGGYGHGSHAGHGHGHGYGIGNVHGVDHGFGGVKYGKLNGSFGSPLGKGGIDDFDLGFMNKDIGGAIGGSFGGFGVAGGIDRSYGGHGHGHGHAGHGAGYGKNTVAVHDSFRVNDVYGGHG